MKYLFLCLSLCAFSLVSCQTTNDKSSSDNKEVSTTDSEQTTAPTADNVFEKLMPNEFEAKYKATEGAVLLDVRTPEEVAEGALEDARNLNINAPNFKEELAKIDRNTPIFLYCRSGGRSGRAADMCKEMGFKEIYDMTSGYMGYSSGK